MKTEEIATQSSVARATLDQTLQALDTENRDLQKKVEELQQQLADSDHKHARRLVAYFCSLKTNLY